MVKTIFDRITILKPPYFYPYTADMNQVIDMAARLDDLKVAVNASKLLLENEKVRITEIALKPGEKTLMHNHPNDYAIYAMSDSRFEQAFPDGKSDELILKAGQAGMMKAGPHEVTNIGKGVARNLIIELK